MNRQALLPVPFLVVLTTMFASNATIVSAQVEMPPRPAPDLEIAAANTSWPESLAVRLFRQLKSSDKRKFELLFLGDHILPKIKLNKFDPLLFDDAPKSNNEIAKAFDRGLKRDAGQILDSFQRLRTEVRSRVPDNDVFHLMSVNYNLKTDTSWGYKFADVHVRCRIAAKPYSFAFECMQVGSEWFSSRIDDELTPEFAPDSGLSSR